MKNVYLILCLLIPLTAQQPGRRPPIDAAPHDLLPIPLERVRPIRPMPLPGLRPPVLITDGKPLKVTQLDLHVEINGLFAETSMTLKFHNPNGRAKAGTLVFPLAVEDSLSGYALDINGTMVDAVVIEKKKGRIVFEKIARQGIDPGLLEWTKGNNFQTRIFPIPANGHRICKVSFISPLKNGVYQLPLRFNEAIPEVNFSICCPGNEAPVVDADKLKWQEKPGRDAVYEGSVSLKNMLLNFPVKITFPNRKQQAIAVEKGDDQRVYFTIQDTLPAPKAGAIQPNDHLVVYWDASHSRFGKDLSNELALLKGIAKLQQAKVFSLVPVRNAEGETQKFNDLDQLLAAINVLSYDGGTTLNLRHVVKDAASVLFTDGLETFGTPQREHFPKNLTVITAAATADFVNLERLARFSGGRFVNLNQQTADQALTGLKARQRTIKSVTGKTDDISPSLGAPIHNDLLLTGALKADQTEVVVTFSDGLVRRYQVDGTPAIKGRLVQRQWAQQQIHELLFEPEKNRSRIFQLGYRFGIVTPETSLIVLENVNQYVEHKIRPPASMPQWRTAYNKHIREAKKQEAEKLSARIDRVAKMQQKRHAWWKKDFKEPKPRQPIAKPKPEPLPLPPAIAATADPFASGVPADADGPPPEAPGGAGAPIDAFAPARESAGLRQVPANADPIGFGGGGRGDGSADKLSRGPLKGDVTVAQTKLDRDWIKAIEKTDAPYTAYLKLKQQHGEKPAFYLDASEWFRRQGKKELALRILSTLAELKMEGPTLNRVLAYRLMQLEYLALASPLLEQVLVWRPEEPQSHRDLALLRERQGRFDEAAALLKTVVEGKWDRFQGIQLIALQELNNVRRKAESKGQPKIELDKRLAQHMPADVRILLTWDADLTDVDLWVTEPHGERVMYSRNRSRAGGWMSRDFTQGYGPEEYFIKKAFPGTYKIQAHFYGSRAIEGFGSVTLQAEIVTDFGRPTEKRKAITLQLRKKKKQVLVGEIKL